MLATLAVRPRVRRLLAGGGWFALALAGAGLLVGGRPSIRHHPVGAAPPQFASTAATINPGETAADSPPPLGRTGAANVTYVFDGEDWDASSVAAVDRALGVLPDLVIARLGNHELGPLKVLVNREGRTLTGAQPYGAAANFYSTNDGDNEVVLFPNQSPMTVLHELGHAYNLRHVAAGRYALVVFDPEMESFMAATGWRLLSSAEDVRRARDQTGLDFAYDGAFTWPRLSHNDPLEDFANSFALYFSDPSSLRGQSPARFAWFDANVGH